MERHPCSLVRSRTGLESGRNITWRGDQPGDHLEDILGNVLWETGSQAEHKTTGHHGKTGELANGRYEWEELKPEVKQPGYMSCPSPNRVASARTCLETD